MLVYIWTAEGELGTVRMWKFGVYLKFPLRDHRQLDSLMDWHDGEILLQ